MLLYEFVKINEEIFSLQNEIEILTENIKNKEKVVVDNPPMKYINPIIWGALAGVLLGAWCLYANPWLCNNIPPIT